MIRKLKEKIFSGLKQKNSGQTDYASPQIHDSAWVAPDAVIIGDVEVGPDTSIWPGTVVRGDIGKVKIGANVNIQDNAVIHPNSNEGMRIGDNVTVAHGSVLDGCNVDNNVLIGINVTLLHHSHVKENTIVGAGSLLTPGTTTERNSVYSGSPAEKVRDLTSDDREIITKMASSYVRLKGEYK